MRESALYIAVWTHSEVIRIHPFEDGNGRSARLLMNAILIRLGMRPVRIEACKDEYISCLNRYYQADDFSSLLDLFLGLYADQLGGI